MDVTNDGGGVAAGHPAQPTQPHLESPTGVVARSANGVEYTVEDLLVLLEDARSYITPTISTHEEISDVIGWCACGYCTHVPKGR